MIVSVLSLCLFAVFTVAASALNRSEFDFIPPLYKLEDYEKCVESTDAPVIYCLVKSNIQPDDNSDNWNLIKKHSQNEKLHFQHNLLHRGICLSKCQKLVKYYEAGSSESLYRDNFNIQQRITLPPEYFSDTLEYRKKYNRVVNKCVNFELKEYYNLTAYSEIESCTSTGDKVEFGYTEYILIAVVSVVALIVICSTMYDLKLKRENCIKDYSTTPPYEYSKLLVSFSIPRNWKSLMAEEKTQLAKDLQCLHGFRFQMSIQVIMAHCVLAFYMLPIENPLESQENYFNYFIAATDFIRFYFTLTAILVTILFMDEMDSGKDVLNFRYFWKGIIDRYVRIVPVYGFVILLRASTISLMWDDGPVWQKYIKADLGTCRKNWWTNLLFVNNYVNFNENCMLEGWYLAVDFQLFILARFIRVIIWRYPKLLKVILGFCIGLSYLVVGWATYANKLDGALVLGLSCINSMKNLYTYDANYLEGYIKTHMHLGDVFIGIVCGIVYYRLRQKKVDLKKFKTFDRIWQLSFPIMLLIIYIWKVFYLYDFEKPSLWMAISSAFFRHSIPWLFAVFFIGMVFNLNTYFTWFLCLPLNRLLAKLSFCAYICHMLVLSPLFMYNLRSPLHSSVSSWIALFSKVLPLTYAYALVLCLAIELPAANVYKHFNNSKRLVHVKTK